MEKPIISNVVAVVDLDCEIELRDLTVRARTAEYNPAKFSAATLKIRDPKTSANVHSNGKMIVAGAKSTKLAKLAAMKHAKTIQLAGFPVKFKNFQVCNVVGRYDYKFPIRLELLASAYPNANFEPEIFPAAFYEMEVPKVKVTVFVNGNIVVTGGRSEDDISRAVEAMRPILWEFRKSDGETSGNNMNMADVHE